MYTWRQTRRGLLAQSSHPSPHSPRAVLVRVLKLGDAQLLLQLAEPARLGRRRGRRLAAKFGVDDDVVGAKRGAKAPAEADADAAAAAWGGGCEEGGGGEEGGRCEEGNRRRACFALLKASECRQKARRSRRSALLSGRQRNTDRNGAHTRTHPRPCRQSRSGRRQSPSRRQSRSRRQSLRVFCAERSNTRQRIVWWPCVRHTKQQQQQQEQSGMSARRSAGSHPHVASIPNKAHQSRRPGRQTSFHPCLSYSCTTRVRVSSQPRTPAAAAAAAAAQRAARQAAASMAQKSARAAACCYKLPLLL